MARGPQGELVELGTATVALNGSGTGTQAVSFTESYVDTPAILVRGRTLGHTPRRAPQKRGSPYR